MFRRDKGAVMDRNKDNVAVSALYTSAVWQWAGLPGAELVTPPDAERVFRFVNGYMRFYQRINPHIFSLPHQLLHRHAAIDHLLRQSGCARVVDVACGFSPRGLGFSADPALDCHDIDLPDMARARRKRLEASAGGRAVLARANYSLRAGDVTTLDFSAEFGDRPTAVVSEGLMMYFPRERQLPIWRGIARMAAANGGVYLFDYIPLSEDPERSGLGKLLHFIRTRVLRLRGDFVYDERDRDAVAADLRACGFDQVEAFSTGDIAQAWGLPQAEVPTRTIIYRCRASAASSSEDA